MAIDSDSDSATVVSRVLAYAASRGVEEITASCRLAELGIDSVGISATGVVLEAEFGIEIKHDELFRCWAHDSVGDLVARLVQLKSQIESTASGRVGADHM